MGNNLHAFAQRCAFSSNFYRLTSVVWCSLQISIFSPAMQDFCVTMTECSSSCCVISEFGLLQHWLCVPTNKYTLWYAAIQCPVILYSYKLRISFIEWYLLHFVFMAVTIESVWFAAKRAVDGSSTISSFILRHFVDISADDLRLL